VLKETVIQSLVEKFGPSVTLDPVSPIFATFPAEHPAVGDVLIEEDGNEITVFIGNITHGHFGSYEEKLSSDEHEAVIALNVTEFLAELFGDKILLFTARWGGGWSRVEDGMNESILSGKKTWFKWSGPISSAGVLANVQ